ncbi:uncharacterized protein LOC106153433 [Lingula anatina]|uniref:Uncharacterized protein LOC106153433 n=1 Tax=Lingula anatina TaxID=7574 RepID=A0A1S3HBE6_LINAN|nr:uncharacterized protein LOC106153433 [Lingula anatina]|eukprot:XP_013382816.1 uncharacterized protein LOC106153433 [Lingula anatina]
MKTLQVLFVALGVTAVVSAQWGDDHKPPRPYPPKRQQISYGYQQPSYQQPTYPPPTYHPPTYQCRHEYFQCPPLNKVYRVDGYGKHTKVYAPNRFYYEHSDPRCYIQCDEAGNAFFRPCPYGQVYNRYLTDYNIVNVCVSDGSGAH